MEWEKIGKVHRQGPLRVQHFEVESEGRVATLPEDVKKTFANLYVSQRFAKGNPEDVMLKYARNIGGGVYANQLEHIGDLTHRLTCDIKYGSINIGCLHEKVNKALNSLNSGYGFEKEARENLANNAEYDGITVEELSEKADAILEEYVQGHQNIPVYNKIQYIAREAAIAYGKKDFEACKIHLGNLQQGLLDLDTFTIQATVVKRNEHGDILTHEASEMLLKQDRDHEIGMSR